MYPKAKVPSVVGRPTKTASHMGVPLPNLLVGDACYDHEQQLSLSHPIVNGVIQNWDDMEILWRHLFDEKLKVRSRPTAYMGGTCSQHVGISSLYTCDAAVAHFFLHHPNPTIQFLRERGLSVSSC
jgi:hypothetical protein